MCAPVHRWEPEDNKGADSSLLHVDPMQGLNSCDQAQRQVSYPLGHPTSP